MKIKSFVKQERVKAITMKDAKSIASTAYLKAKHLLACLLPRRLSALFCSRGGVTVLVIYPF